MYEWIDWFYFFWFFRRRCDPPFSALLKVMSRLTSELLAEKSSSLDPQFDVVSLFHYCRSNLHGFPSSATPSHFSVRPVSPSPQLANSILSLLLSFKPWFYAFIPCGIIELFWNMIFFSSSIRWFRSANFQIHQLKLDVGSNLIGLLRCWSWTIVLHPWFSLCGFSYLGGLLGLGGGAGRGILRCMSAAIYGFETEV